MEELRWPRPFYDLHNSYLPGTGDYYDQQGSAPRARLAHCTASWLTPATTSNRRGSSVKFLIVGSSVRADPVFINEKVS